MGDGRYAPSLPLFGGLSIWKANPKIVETLAETRRAVRSRGSYMHSYMHCWRHKTPIIYRATTQWFAGMDECRLRGKPAESAARRRRCAASRRRLLPGLGPGAPARHDREPAGLDALAPAPVGRADAVLHPQGNGRAASAHARAARSGRASESSRAASRRGSALDPRNCSAPTPACTKRSRTRSTSGSIPATTH